MSEPNWKERAEAAERMLAAMRYDAPVDHDWNCRFVLFGGACDCTRERRLDERYGTIGNGYVPRAELERVQRQNAAMRSTFELVLELAIPLDLVNRIHDALPPDAGAKLLTPEQVQPLADAIQNVAENLKTLGPDLAGKISDARRVLSPAVSHARSLGLLPTNPNP